jgi:glucose-1-phosphate cytidylyltransferase
MKTVILCGGYGTRIRDVADNLPKPMIPIGDLPILWHIMKYYSCFGHKDFVLCLGYKSEVIKDFFANYKQRVSDFTIALDGKQAPLYHDGFSEADWMVTLAETGMNAMTGARIRKIRRYIGNDDMFMLTYGDGVGDIDIDALLRFHRSHGKAMTLTGVQPPGRFGELSIGKDGLVEGFNEKPQSIGGCINGGFFVCDKRIFDYLDDREDLVFERDPMEALVRDGQLMVYRHEGFWQPMDTYREYQLLNDRYAKGNAPWVIWK